MVEPRRFLPEMDFELPSVNLHYSRACIIEAVIDIKCQAREDLNLDELESVFADRDNYSKSDPMFLAEGTIDFSSGSPKGETTGSVVGYTRTRTDNSCRIFSRVDGMAFSWTGQYENWTTFRDEAWLLWQEYQSVARPTSIERIGVRYINKFDIRGNHVEFSDYLRTSVNVSPYLPQLVTGFFLQVQVPIVKHDAIATVTSTIAPQETPEVVSLVLDLDCWRGSEIIVEPGSDEHLWAALEQLRLTKNYVFEACITDATRELIR